MAKLKWLDSARRNLLTVAFDSKPYLERAQVEAMVSIAESQEKIVGLLEELVWELTGKKNDD